MKCLFGESIFDEDMDHKNSQNSVYEIQRSTAKVLGIVLVLLSVVCFVSNIVAFSFYLDRADSLSQGG